MASLADVKKRAARKRVAVSLCVAGDLVAEHQRLERDLSDALAADRDGTVLAERVRKTEDRMRSSTFDFLFEALPGDQWRDLMEANPAEEGSDLRWGRSFESAAVKACLVSPKGSDADFDAVWESVGPGGRLRLLYGAVDANEGGISVPFSVSASALLKSSPTSSPTASPSASPAPSTSDG